MWRFKSNLYKPAVVCVGLGLRPDPSLFSAICLLMSSIVSLGRSSSGAGGGRLEGAGALPWLGRPEGRAGSFAGFGRCGVTSSLY